MADQLDWVFNGVDKFSGPVGGMFSSLTQFAFGLNNVKDLLASFAEGVESIGEKAFEFGKFGVEALAFKESTLVGFETLLGTREEAQALFTKAQTMADLTPFKTHDVVDAFRQGLGAGFTKDEVPIVFQAIGDLASFRGTKEEMHNALVNMSQDVTTMMGRGTADMIHLKQIFGASGGMLNMTRFSEALGKNMGMAPAAAMAALHSGAIKSYDAVVALVDAVSTLDKGQVGSSLIRNAKTINGLLSTAASLGENFFYSMTSDVMTSGGIGSFKDALVNVIGYFNVVNDTGKRVSADLQSVFSGALTAIFGDLSGGAGKDLISRTMEPILKWVEGVDWVGTFTSIKNVVVNVVEVLYSFGQGMWDVFGPVFSVLGSFLALVGGGKGTNGLAMMARLFGIFQASVLGLAGALALLFLPAVTLAALSTVAILAWSRAIGALFDVDWDWDAIKGGFSEMGKWFSDHWSMFTDWGSDIMLGIVEGIKSMAGRLFDTIVDVGRDIKEVFTGSGPGGQKIKSPSGVFQEYGAFMAEGLALGIEGGTDDVEAAIRALGTGTPSMSAASGAGGGLSVTFSDGSIRIDARGGDGETIARQLKAILVSELAMAFEGLAMEGGAA